MLDTTTFVGLDVHARSIKAVSLDVMTGEVRCATFGYDAAAVAEWVRSVDPRARCVYGVRGHGVRPPEEALRPGCRLRGRRRLEDDQAQRGQAQEERPQRRRVPRPHAVGRQRGRGVGPRRRVRGRPRPDQGARGREGRPLALEAAALQVPAQARARLRREDAHRPQEGQLDRAHWSWIESIRFAEGPTTTVLAYYVDAVRRAAEEKSRLEGLVEAEARKPRWRRRVDSLRCLKASTPRLPPTSCSRPASSRGSGMPARSRRGSA